MPGKACAENPSARVIARETRAYCEGRAANKAGAAKTTNPHVASGRAEAVWNAGWDSWTADPAGYPSRDCCADIPGGGYVPP